MYSEIVYFEGAFFAHIVAYEEWLRLSQITERCVALIRQRERERREIATG
jgi:hypothetical protein